MTAKSTLAIYIIDAVIMIGALSPLTKERYPGQVERLLPRKWLFAAAVIIGLVMLAMAEPLRHPFEDFIESYYRSGQAYLTGGRHIERLYRTGVSGFVNIPIVAVQFAPFALLTKRVAAWVYLGLGVMVGLATFRLLAKGAGLGARERRILAVLMLGNGPLMNSLKEGNTSHFALYALALALIWLHEHRSTPAGALLGFVTVLKLPLALYAVWGVLRARWRFAVAMMFVLSVTLLLSICEFGLGPQILWYRQFVASAAAQPLGAFNVQTFPATLLRVMRPAEVMCSWNPVAVVPWFRVVAAACSGALLLGFACLLLWSRLRAPDEDNALRRDRLNLEFSMVCLLACCTTPLAWSHYYCWALLPIAHALSTKGGLSGSSRLKKGAWVFAIGLLSLPVAWPWCRPHGWLALPYSLCISHYLFGALVMLLLLASEYASLGHVRVPQQPTMTTDLPRARALC